MKKIFFPTFATLIAVAMTACGGSDEKTENQEGAEKEGTEKAGAVTVTVTASPENQIQEYAQFVTFEQPVTVSVDGHMMEAEVAPAIIAAAEKINDNGNTELILMDEKGAQLASLHPFGRDSQFQEALFSGTVSYTSPITFISSFKSDEEANDVASKAKSYKIVMPLQERVEEEQMMDVEGTQNEESSVNDLKEWDPVGTYEMVDNDGIKFTLTVKKGGKAILFNHSLESYEEYDGSTGSWVKSSKKGYVEMDFFGMPFIHIGTDSSVSAPVLTPEYFYLDSEAYPDGACLEVKKVN